MKNVANLETDVSFALYYYSRMLKEWLKEALKVSKTSQAELSRQLTEKLDRSIDRAAVNKMLKGGRNIAADELLAMQEIMQIDYAPSGSGHQLFNEHISDRARKLREGKKLTQTDLADMIGVTPQSIQALESGRVKDPKYIVKLANALSVPPEFLAHGGTEANIKPVEGIRVEGVSKAGEFLDITLMEDDEYEREIISAPRDSTFPHAHQYALRVDGDSMNKRFPSGCYVICAAWGDIGMDFTHGMILHVERITAAGLRETTIKCFEVVEDKAWLAPLSTNPKHKPIEINGNEDMEIHIKGLIVSKWERVAY